MLENLFGADMPLAVRFFLAFVVVLGALGLFAWAVRRFGAGRLGGAGTRGRQPRLAVIEYATVDNRRRLILVRRDNVEHLLMIGGPTDVVVEPNIVRAVAATAARPTAGIEALPRAAPLPDNGSNGTWPLQPEQPTALRPAQPATEPPPRPQRDTLAALADELSSRPAPAPAPAPRKMPLVPRPAPAEPRAEAKPEPRIDVNPEPRVEMKPEPRAATPEPPAPAAPVAAAAPIVPPAPPKAAAAAEPPQSADQSLADMAQRLEAALRKPGAGPEGRPQRPMPSPASDQGQPTEAAPTTPRPPRVTEPKPARPEAAKPNQSKTTLYDSLEQEMASLLGRQTKT